MSNDGRLPVKNYDHLTVETLRHVIRSLSRESVQDLLDYESDHADRPLVKRVLATRMEELAAGATPTSGDPPPGPEPTGPPGDRQRVRPDSQAPRTHGPTHGVPSSRGEPRRGPN